MPITSFTRQCDRCGDAYTAQRRTSRYCSVTCRSQVIARCAPKLAARARARARAGARGLAYRLRPRMRSRGLLRNVHRRARPPFFLQSHLWPPRLAEAPAGGRPMILCCKHCGAPGGCLQLVAIDAAAPGGPPAAAAAPAPPAAAGQRNAPGGPQRAHVPALSAQQAGLEPQGAEVVRSVLQLRHRAVRTMTRNIQSPVTLSWATSSRTAGPWANFAK